MDQTRHAKPPQEHYPDVQCAWNQARNPNTTSRRAICLHGVGAPGQLPSGTTCRRSTILCPAEPPSRICNAAPRAVAPVAHGHLPRVVRSGCKACKRAPEALSTDVRCRLRMVGSAGNGAVQQSLAHVQKSKSHQCPVAASQNQCAQSSEPCARRPDWPSASPLGCFAGHGAPEPPACKQHQPSRRGPVSVAWCVCVFA